MSGSWSPTMGQVDASSHACAHAGRRNGRGQAASSRHDADEGGFTIIELLLSVLILSIIIGLSTTTVRMFYTQSADVQNTFAVTNQVLLASEILTEYTHDGVASCPSTDSACTTSNGENAFVTATPTSAVFFADTNDTSTATGPVKVTISLTGTTLTASVASPTSGCPLTSTATTVCTYANPTRTVTTVYNETNPSPLSYMIVQGGSCSSASVGAPSTTPPLPTQISEIVGVCVDLDAKMNGGQAAGYQSLAYMLAPTYNVNVG
jgi:type II secretory pathway pseudopilin PulG